MKGKNRECAEKKKVVEDLTSCLLHVSLVIVRKCWEKMLRETGKVSFILVCA